MIEVLADLKSRDNLSKGLSEDLLTGQIYLGSNLNASELPPSTSNEVGNYAALLPKHSEAIHSDAPVRSPSHKKPEGKQLNRLPAMIDSSHHSFAMPEEDADTELKESDTLRSPGKTNDLRDVFTGDVVEQDDGKAKSTKRQRKTVKKVLTDKTTQSLDEQVNQVTREGIEGVHASVQEDLVQGGSVIDTPMENVAKVQKKGKRAPKSRAPKIKEANHSTHAAKDSQDENAIGITGIRDNENASGYPTELAVVQKDSTDLKSSSPNARKKRKKHLKTELQSRDSAMEHDPSANLECCSAEKDLVSPKSSAADVETNQCIQAHRVSDKINFIDHFSLGNMNDRLVSAENIQNNEDEIMEAENKKNNTGSTEQNDALEYLLPAENTSLTGHFGSSEVVVPSAKAENMNREYDNVKSGKEKRTKKRKPNSEWPAADEEHHDGDHQGTVIGTQNSLHSAVQNGRMGQNNGNENNNKVTQNVSIMNQEPEDAAVDRTVEKKLHRRDISDQNNLPINKVNAKMSKELRKSTSQKKEPVSSFVRGFNLSPTASGDSIEGTPQIASRFRLTVRKVPKNRYEQANAKSKMETRKLGSGAISEESDDAMDTKGEKATLETASDNSSASANSGISSTAYDDSDVPDDDDGALSLSQKSLRGGLQIGSILRGSSSYKKAKQKQAELLDDDTEVPDSQPADDLWG